MTEADRAELTRLRSVQREAAACAIEALCADDPALAEFHLLGVNDYFIEELLMTEWKRDRMERT